MMMARKEMGDAMGAWGYKPFENDAAGDWSDPIDKFLLRKIGATLKKGKVDDLNTAAQWYAAAGLLAGLQNLVGYPVDSDTVALAVQRLDELYAAAPEMGWKDTARYQREVAAVKHVFVLARRRLRERRRRADVKRQQKRPG